MVEEDNKKKIAGGGASWPEGNINEGNDEARGLDKDFLDRRVERMESRESEDEEVRSMGGRSPHLHPTKEGPTPREDEEESD